MDAAFPSRLVDVATVAARLGVSARTVRQWATDGRLTPYRVGGYALRLDLDQAEQLVVAHGRLKRNVAETRG